MIVIGIDPGASGAIAIWDKGIKHINKCPKEVTKMADIVSIVKDKDTVAYIEQVHAFPTDGRSSAFKFGANYGKWLGVLGAYKIETKLVTPQKWMKYWQNKLNIKLPKDKPNRKRTLKEIASHYTDRKVTLYNSDAILITLYGLYIEQEGDSNDSQRGKGKV